MSSRKITNEASRHPTRPGASSMAGMGSGIHSPSVTQAPRRSAMPSSSGHHSSRPVPLTHNADRSVRFEAPSRRDPTLRPEASRNVPTLRPEPSSRAAPSMRPSPSMGPPASRAHPTRPDSRYDLSSARRPSAAIPSGAMIPYNDISRHESRRPGPSRSVAPSSSSRAPPSSGSMIPTGGATRNDPFRDPSTGRTVVPRSSAGGRQGSGGYERVSFHYESFSYEASSG